MNYFYAGMNFDFDGVWYRVREGNRCPGDLVLEFNVQGWHRPTIAHTLILAAFKYQVEENNYGPQGKVMRGQGGDYLLAAIKRACINGWQLEAQVIKQQTTKVAARKAIESDAVFEFISGKR